MTLSGLYMVYVLCDQWEVRLVAIVPEFQVFLFLFLLLLLLWLYTFAAGTASFSGVVSCLNHNKKAK